MEGTNSNKKNVIILCSIVGLIVVLLVVLAYLILLQNKNIFVGYYDQAVKIVDDVFEEYDKTKDKEDDFSKIALEGKLSADIDLNNEMLDEDTKKLQDAINDLEFKYDIKLDQKENYFQLALSALKDNKELINADMVAENDVAYIKVKDIIDEYYKIELDEAINFEMDIDEFKMVDDIEVLYDIAKKEARHLFDNENVSKSNTKLEIDGKDVKVKEHKLVVSEETLKEMELAVLKAIKEDNKALESYINILNSQSYYEDEDEIKDELDNNIKSLEEEIKDLKEEEKLYNMIVKIYTKGFKNTIVKVELGTIDDEEYKEITSLYINKIDKNTTEYVLESDDDEMKVTVEDKGKDAYNIVIEVEDVKIVFDGTIKNEIIDITYEMEADDEKIAGKLYLEEIGENSMKGAFLLEQEDLGEIGINIEMNYSDEFEKPDISKATDDINESEVQTKLSNKLKDLSEELGIDLENYINPSKELEEIVPQDFDTITPQFDTDYYDTDYNDLESLENDYNW